MGGSPQTPTNDQLQQEIDQLNQQQDQQAQGKYVPFPKPDPQSIGGLNSVFVLGQNLQGIFPLNSQFVIGSNLQLCVNPFYLLEWIGIPIPGVLAATGASGAGGNMQFSIGTNTQVSIGPSYQFNLPDQKTIKISDTHAPTIKIAATIIAATLLAWYISVYAVDDEDTRASLSIIFQTTMNAMLIVFMTMLMLWNTEDHMYLNTMRGMFLLPGGKDVSGLGEGLGVATVSAVLATSALIVPGVAAGVAEGHFASQQ